MERWNEFPRGNTGRLENTLVAFPLSRMPAEPFSTSSSTASATIANGKTYCERSSMTFGGNMQRSTRRSWCGPCSNWRGKRTARGSYALSTLPKRMTPSTEPSCGLSWLALACHLECSSSSVNSTRLCEHACAWAIAISWICFDAEQGRLRGCVLAPLFFIMIFHIGAAFGGGTFRRSYSHHGQPRATATEER